MNDTIRQFRNFFVSMRLTVVLLVLSMVLIFIATLDQVNLGIWAVQEKYFRSFFVLWNVRDVPVPIFPGGYLIGGLLLINLISAQRAFEANSKVISASDELLRMANNTV